MKKDLFKKVLKDNGIELTDSVNFDVIWDEVDKAIGGASKSGKEYAMKNMVKDVKETAINEFIVDLKLDGVENTNQLKAMINSLSSEEVKQDLINARNESQKWQSQAEEYESKFKQVDGQLVNYQRINDLSKNGINPQFVEYASHSIGQMITEEKDYETAKKEWLETNPQYLSEQNKQPITTGKPRVVQQPQSQVSGVRQVMIDKGWIKE